MIYIVRHTKVTVTPGTCYGWSDVPLAESYPSELADIRKQLVDVKFDHIYSSPSTRCSQLANDLGGSVMIDDRLREMHFGEWEWLTWDMIYERHDSREWFDNYMTHPTPGGESFADVQRRVASFFETLPIDGNTLIVTHAGVIRAIKGLGKADFETEIPFGSIIKIQ